MAGGIIELDAVMINCYVLISKTFSFAVEFSNPLLEYLTSVSRYPRK